MTRSEMTNSNSIITIQVGGGQVRITDKTIQVDISPFGSFKRLYQRSKFIFSFFISGMLLMVVVFILDPSPYYRTLSQFMIAFVILGFSLGYIVPRVRNNIGSASEISRTTVDRVEYTTGSRLLPSKLLIIVTEGEKTGTRPVPLSYRRLGDQQLEDAIEAFEEAGITIVPADEND